MNLPQREGLPHEMPLWVRPEDEIYFLTICCQIRRQNQLCHKPVAAAIFETVAHRHERGLWHAHLFLLMPDHVHALISCPTDEKDIQSLIFQWKEWTAKQIGIGWQRDFFEHRLRREESIQEKSEYIRQNPVRAGLVQNAVDWSFLWIPNPQGQAGPHARNKRAQQA